MSRLQSECNERERLASLKDVGTERFVVVGIFSKVYRTLREFVVRSRIAIAIAMACASLGHTFLGWHGNRAGGDSD